MENKLKISKAHIVDVLGNVVGRDQQIMTLLKACDLVNLIDKDDFINNDVIFFDPFCKAGELLLAGAFYSCWYKFMNNKNEFKVDDVSKELYEANRYFGLSPDERHFRLSLRTFLGNTFSHDEQYNQIIRDGHYLSEIDGKLNLDKFNTEFNSMIEYIKGKSNIKKIIAIGNPPYQESDGGFGKSAKSIYDLFVQTLIDSNDIREFVLVIPARWFGGGKGLGEFRSTMMKSKKVKHIKYFSNSSNVFPTVDINGGVCFLHYDKSYDGLTEFSDENFCEIVDLEEFDIIPDDPIGYKIIRKILSKWKDEYVGKYAWSEKPFGLRTNYFEKNREDNPKSINSVPCLSRNKKIKYVNKSNVTKNNDSIDKWKVSVPAVAGGSKGKRRSTIPKDQIFMIPKGTISTETYNIIDVFDSKIEAEHLIQYLKTDFARYLVGLRKITQHVPKDRWNWVPYVNVNRMWTDKELAQLFELTDVEMEHIKTKVKEWS